MRIDLILENLTAVTVDDAHPTARRIGVHQGRVVALDDDLDGVSAHRTADLAGACVVPGFVDAHNHMTGYGLGLDELDLSSPPMATVDDVYAAVAERAREVPEGGWIIGSGYDQNKLAGEHPRREALDRAAPGHNVWLRHTSGHMCVVNSAVLELTGIPSGTPVPEGGAAVRDADGSYTGLLQEQAQGLVKDLVYPYPVDRLAAAIGKASQRYLREGLTSCTEAGIGGGWVGHSPIEAAAFMAARESGALGVRVRLMVAAEALVPVPGPEGALGLPLGLRTGFGDDRLRLGAVKIFSDGSLLGRTAAMCCDFADEVGNRGYLQAAADTLRERILGAHAGGWQVATHAIGDAAIDLVLDAYADAARRFPRTGTRHRIEHCGVARPDQLPRLAELGVVPVPQAGFVGQIGDGMRAALGEDRVPWCYRHRSFLDAGLVVAGSSDRPVIQGPPLYGLHDMVNRRTQSGAPFAPEEAVTPLEALRAYTLGGAYAGFEEHEKGTITPGKLADLTVLSADPTAIDPAGIRDIEVLETYVSGVPSR